MEEKIKISVRIAKLAVYSQGILEALDELKNTSVYSGKLRGLANRIETEISKHDKINNNNEYAQAIITDLSNQMDSLFEQYEKILIENIVNK